MATIVAKCTCDPLLFPHIVLCDDRVEDVTHDRKYFSKQEARKRIAAIPFLPDEAKTRLIGQVNELTEEELPEFHTFSEQIVAQLLELVPAMRDYEREFIFKVLECKGISPTALEKLEKSFAAMPYDMEKALDLHLETLRDVSPPLREAAISESVKNEMITPEFAEKLRAMLAFEGEGDIDST